MTAFWTAHTIVCGLVGCHDQPQQLAQQGEKKMKKSNQFTVRFGVMHDAMLRCPATIDVAQQKAAAEQATRDARAVVRARRSRNKLIARLQDKPCKKERARIDAQLRTLNNVIRA